MPDGSQQLDVATFGHPVFKTIDDLLGNWARWSRARKGQGHCASIEHGYCTPNHFHPPPVHPAIDVLSALAVEREMRQMPFQHQQAIVWHYVWLAPSGYICRRLKIRHSNWEWFLADAVCMISNRMRRQGVRG